jgi:hypothetical protein
MLGLSRFEKMMFFEMREKFPEIRCDGFTSDTEFVAQLFANLYFRAALFQKFEHPRPYEV